jgi:hypothetical protein
MSGFETLEEHCGTPRIVLGSNNVQRLVVGQNFEIKHAGRIDI